MRHGYQFQVFEQPQAVLQKDYYVFIDDELEARRRIQKHIPVKKPTQIKKVREIPARLFHIQNIPFGWCGTQNEKD
jgi:hypothetical protein